MKKENAFMPFWAIVIVISFLFSCQFEKKVHVVGSLTAYYALEDFKTSGIEYKKGQLICDTNNPIDRIVDEDADNYRYEGDENSDGGYSWILPKSKVEKKTYTMNQLTASDIGNKAIFVAENGYVAQIFWSNINEHCYYNINDEEKYCEEERYKECYVLSVEVSSYNNEKYLFEEQLEERQGCIKLYCQNRYAGNITDPRYCRYREGPIGIIEECFVNKDGWECKTAYDEDGNLLVDQWEVIGYLDYISIAYIADLDALYVDGRLYYRSSDKE